MSPAITAGQLKRLADQMAHLNAARDIPTGELYRSIAEDQYNKVRQEFQAAVDAALTAAEAQPVQEPVACQHKRQKWAINMRTGSCSDCGATFVFGRNGEPEKWSAPAAAPPQPVPLTDEQIGAVIQTNWGYGRDNFIAVARAIERAHGIEGKS
jgi:ferredoxin-like protein FixX